jgi:GrpB-like predicted nucleotidyltransferase (UPF0157 family)
MLEARRFLAWPIALRDHLRADPSDAVVYSSLKKQLAERFAQDIEACVAGKTEFIMSILVDYKFSVGELESIRRANQPK